MRSSIADYRIVMLLLILPLLIFSNCRYSDSSSANTGQAQKAANEYKYAFAMHSCAPWDGSAIDFYLTPTPTDGDKVTRPYLSINLYKHVGEIAGNTFEIDNSGKIGWASICPASGDCLMVKSGKIHIKSVSADNKISVEYELEFQGGKHISGEFQANLSNNRALCG